MVERICPECRAANDLDADTCMSCGALIEQPLVQQRTHALAQRTSAVPVRWQRAGKAVALGAVALAVEVGAAWLQQRSSNKPAPLARRATTTPQNMRRYVARQRVWETYEQGTLTRRVVEQTVWNLPED